MSQLLSLSRAARLAGVSRGELQKKVRSTGAETFEGQITIDELLKLYPDIDLDSDPMLERVRQIKSQARPKKHYSDGWLPDPQVLMARLGEFQHTLVQTKSALNASEALLHQTVERLRSALSGDDAALREAASDCLVELQSAMGRLERAGDAKARLFAKDALLKLATASVRVLPSGHDFFVEGNDSILEAGLKAGLYLDYGCTSGNCGACKCKVVSGAVRKLREHDYVLSAAEKTAGVVLACSNTAISDLVIEASEAGVDEEIPRQSIRAQVHKIELQGDDLALLHVKTPRTRSLRFKAGQWVEVETEAGCRSRLYIASCPCDGRNLQFLVERGSGVAFAEQVFSGELARQMVMIEGPEGEFVLQGGGQTPLYFIAKQGGFSPIKSLLEQAITVDEAEAIGLLHVGGCPEDSSLAKLVRSWDDWLDQFDYASVDNDLPPEAVIDRLQQWQASAGTARVVLAGPPDWLGALQQAAGSRGVDCDGWLLEAVGP